MKRLVITLIAVLSVFQLSSRPTILTKREFYQVHPVQEKAGTNGHLPPVMTSAALVGNKSTDSIRSML